MFCSQYTYAEENRVTPVLVVIKKTLIILRHSSSAPSLPKPSWVPPPPECAFMLFAPAMLPCWLLTCLCYETVCALLWDRSQSYLLTNLSSCLSWEVPCP